MGLYFLELWSALGLLMVQDASHLCISIFYVCPSGQGLRLATKMDIPEARRRGKFSFITVRLQIYSSYGFGTGYKLMLKCLGPLCFQPNRKSGLCSWDCVSNNGVKEAPQMQSQAAYRISW